MKIILKEDVSSLGKQGEVINVKDGYARNYLLPKNLAMEATAQGIKVVALSQKRQASQELKEQDTAQDLAEKLEAQEVKIKAKVGENEKLFGSVTASDIAAALADAGIMIDKRKIKLEHPLKELGVYTVAVKLHNAVEAKVKVWIEADTSHE